MYHDAVHAPQSGAEMMKAPPPPPPPFPSPPRVTTASMKEQCFDKYFYIKDVLALFSRWVFSRLPQARTKIKKKYLLKFILFSLVISSSGRAHAASEVSPPKRSSRRWGDEGMSCLQCTMVMWVGGKGLSTPDPPLHHVHSTWEEKVGKTLVSSKRQESS